MQIPTAKILAASLTIMWGMLAVPGVASAKSNDSKYCEALAEKYDTYIDTSGNMGGRPTPVAVQKAEDSCQTDPASAIPVLEKTLKDARFTLPPRQ
jgi:hypothetical protein